MKKFSFFSFLTATAFGLIVVLTISQVSVVNAAYWDNCAPNPSGTCSKAPLTGSPVTVPIGDPVFPASDSAAVEAKASQKRVPKETLKRANSNLLKRLVNSANKLSR